MLGQMIFEYSLWKILEGDKSTSSQNLSMQYTITTREKYRKTLLLDLCWCNESDFFHPVEHVFRHVILTQFPKSCRSPKLSNGSSNCASSCDAALWERVDIMVYVKEFMRFMFKDWGVKRENWREIARHIGGERDRYNSLYKKMRSIDSSSY